MTAVMTTKQVLDAALRDYIAEITDGSFLTEYFLVSASTSMEDIGTARTMYAFVTADNQAPHVTLGLLAYARDNGTVVDDDD